MRMLLPWIGPIIAVAVTIDVFHGGQSTTARAEDPVFSGPQPGEPLTPFVVRGVYDEDAGRELDFVGEAERNPLVLVFVHDVNRLSISFTRVLTAYTASRAKDKLHSGVILLDDDTTEAENTLKRIRHALTPEIPTGVSIDGGEGPGSYGLNRKVNLTILVAKEGKVTANFAIIQPSLQVDMPRVVGEIVKLVGGSTPSLEELQALAGMQPMMRMSKEGSKEASSKASGDAAGGPDLRALLAPVIRRDSKPEEVESAALRVEKLADSDPAVRREVARIANTIVNSGKLSNYGTERAQEFLQKWAQAYGR